MAKLKLDKNILHKKIAGVPVPIVAVAAGVGGLILYRKFGHSASDVGPDGTSLADGGATGGMGEASGGGSGAFGSEGSSTDGLYPQPIANVTRLIHRRVRVRKTVTVKRLRPGNGARGRNQVRNRTVTNQQAIKPLGNPRRRYQGDRSGSPTLIRSTATIRTRTHRGPGNNSRRTGASPPIIRSR